jgi:hypothetical protein
MNYMVQIFIVAYPVLGLLAAMLLWAALMTSKRLENSQGMKSEPARRDRLFAPKTEPSNFHPS